MKDKNEIKELSKIYKTVFDNAADGILIAGIENQKFYIGNKMICEMLGYSLEEIKNMGLMDIHPEEDLPYVMKQFKRLSRKEMELAKDIPVRRKDGSIFYADIKSFSVTILGERYIAGIFRDITERKRMEEALQNREKSVRTLLNIPMAAAFLLDRNGICLEANETLAKRLGKKVSDIVGKSIWEIFPSDVSAKRKAHFEGVLVSKQQCRYEDERHGMWNDSVISPILDEQGEVTKVAVFGLDITERKQAEEFLKEKDRELEIKAKNLEEANIALKVLLRRTDEDRAELEEKVSLNVRDLVIPYLEKLKNSSMDEIQRTFVNILESNLLQIISPFTHRMSSKFLNFTPTEIQVADLLRKGKTSKEIGELLNASPRSITFHRENIRKKMGLKNKKANLKSYLLSLK